MSKAQDQLKDKALVNNISKAMAQKLKVKREQGRGGWHHPDGRVCNNEKLFAMLQEHIYKGDMVDVAIIAAMINERHIMYGENTFFCES